MPYLIPRQQAIDKINLEKNPNDCLICWLVNTRTNYIIEKSKNITVLLSEYPRTWGQIMVLLNQHLTSFNQLSKEQWSEFSEKLLLATQINEKVLNPLRCYVASTGASDNLPMTCPHIHFNVIPVYNEDDRPSNIFTWKNGLYAAEKDEWEELFNEIKKEWNLTFFS